MMIGDIELRIARELGANAYRIHAYRRGMYIADLVGYINHRAHTVKCYPARILVNGNNLKFPFVVSLCDIPWEKKTEVN